MKSRIVLSACAAFVLLLAACGSPATNGGIGTSPSGPGADDEQLQQTADPLTSGVDAAPVDAGPQLQVSGIPILAPIVAFALSKEGIALLISGALWLWRKAVKDEARRKTIAEYADQAFKVAEATGLYEKLDGRGKYKVFIQTIVDALKADEKREPTAKEMAALTELAKRKAWIGKLPAPAPRTLPLPPPPRG